MVDTTFEAMQLIREKTHDFTMHFVLGGVAEPVEPPRDEVGSRVDHVVDEALTVLTGGRHELLAAYATDRLDQAEQSIQRPTDRLTDVDAVARLVAVGWKREDLLVPATAVLVEEHEVVALGERLLPSRQGCRWIATQLLVGPLHEVECVVIEPEQHVQPVLLDPLMMIGVATTCTLAAQAPSRLIHRDLMTGPQLLRGCQFERCGNGSGTATEHCHTSNSCFHPEAPICRSDELRSDISPHSFRGRKNVRGATD